MSSSVPRESRAQRKGVGGATDPTHGHRTWGQDRHVTQEAVRWSSPRQGSSLQEEGEHREVTGRPRQTPGPGVPPGDPTSAALHPHLPLLPGRSGGKGRPPFPAPRAL